MNWRGQIPGPGTEVHPSPGRMKAARLNQGDRPPDVIPCRGLYLDFLPGAKIMSQACGDRSASVDAISVKKAEAVPPPRPLRKIPRDSGRHIERGRCNRQDMQQAQAVQPVDTAWYSCSGKEIFSHGLDDSFTIRNFSVNGQRLRWTSLTTSTLGYSLALCLDIPLALPLRFARVSCRMGGYSSIRCTRLRAGAADVGMNTDTPPTCRVNQGRIVSPGNALMARYAHRVVIVFTQLVGSHLVDQLIESVDYM